MKSFVCILALAITCANAFDVVSLTRENYDALTAGKAVFIKFFAPWCKHCNDMAPDWVKLAQAWDGHDVGLVAQVDCTAEGKALCDANRIRGFPTLKYGDPNSLEDYQGRRSLEDLMEFADEHLKEPVCSPAHLDRCDDHIKKQLQDYMKLEIEEIDSKITARDSELEKLERQFTEAVKKLQEEFQRLSAKKYEVVHGIKEDGLGLMKAVQHYKKKKENVGMFDTTSEHT